MIEIKGNGLLSSPPPPPPPPLQLSRSRKQSIYGRPLLRECSIKLHSMLKLAAATTVKRR